MGQLCERAPAVTGQTGRVGFVDQGHAGEETEHAAAVHDVELQAGKKPGGQTGFVPLPRRRVVERGFAWLVQVVAVDGQVIAQTLTSDRPDFEDAIRYFAAAGIPGLAGIVTREPKGFAAGQLPVLSPAEALQLIS